MASLTPTISGVVAAMLGSSDKATVAMFIRKQTSMLIHILLLHDNLTVFSLQIKMGV